MKPFLLALAAALALAACQSSPATSKKVPAGVPPEENAAPPADTAGTR